MSPAQIEACAKRLPKAEREEFLRLHREAGELIARGWALRRAAWAIHRTFKAPRTLDPRPAPESLSW